MTPEPLDYTTILADLEAKKSALEQTIASLRQAMALGAAGQAGEGGGSVPSMAVPSFVGGEVPTGAFLGKSIPEAAKLYLEIVKQKKTTKEICDALEKGGMETNSKSFLKTVHGSLTRARLSENPSLVQVGKYWGLAGWFPKGVVTNATAPKPAKKKKSAKSRLAKPAQAKATTEENKPASAATVKRPAPPPATEESAAPAASEKKRKGETTEKILTLLGAKPGVELTPKEVADQTGLNVQVANICLRNLARAKRAEKTPSGAYRLPTQPSATHAVA